MAASLCACDDDDNDDVTQHDAELTDSATQDAAHADAADATTDSGLEDASDAESDGDTDAADASDGEIDAEQDASDGDISEDADDSDVEVPPCAENLEENEVCISENGLYPGRIPAGSGNSQAYRLKISQKASIDIKITSPDGQSCPDGLINISLETKEGARWNISESVIQSRQGECALGSYNLSPGEYRIRVTEDEGHEMPMALQIEIGEYRPCGNGVYDANEVCDDGNRFNGDGCASDCTVERGYKCTNPTATHASTCTKLKDGENCDLAIEVTTFPFELSGTNFCTDFSSDLSLGENCSSSISSQDVSDVVFKIDLEANEKVNVAETDRIDSVISFLDGECSSTPSCLKDLSSDLGVNESDGLTYIATEPTTIYAVVEKYSRCESGSFSSGATDNAYNIVITKEEVSCGDGIAEGLETCDIGNRSSEGCVDCQLTPGWTCNETSCHVVVCGDGQVEGDETCDTGGVTGEGCDAHCQVEQGFSCVTQIQQNPQSQCYATTLESGDGLSCATAGVIASDQFRALSTNFNAHFTGTLSLNGDQCSTPSSYITDSSPTAFYQIHLQPNEIVHASLSSNAYAAQMAFIESCNASAACLDEAHDAYGSISTELEYTADQEKDIFLIVRSSAYTPSTETHALTHDLRVTRHFIACGDGLLEGEEACDDHNNLPNDGCAADCTIETGYACTYESPSQCYPSRLSSGDADTCATAGVITGDSYHAIGDHFAEDFTGSLDINIANPSCSSAYNGHNYPDAIYKMSLQAGEIVEAGITGDLFGTIFVLKGDSCDNLSCNRTMPVQHLYGSSEFLTYEAATNEEIYIVFKVGSGNSVYYQNDYHLFIQKRIPICGDGRVEGIEQCDDGPDAFDSEGHPKDGDGCSSSCVVEDNYACTGEPSVCELARSGDVCNKPIQVEFDDDGSYQYSGEDFGEDFQSHWIAGDNCTGFYSSERLPEAIFRVDLAANELLTVSDTASNALYAYIHIVTGDCNLGYCAVNDGGFSASFSASYLAEENETVYVIVEVYSDSSIYVHDPYSIRFEKHMPECGDGIREGNEECDTGSTSSEGCISCRITEGYACTKTNPSVCFIPSVGDTCNNPLIPVYTQGIYEISGRSFSDDFSSQWTLSSGCMGSIAQSEEAPEVFIQIDMRAGNIVTVSETDEIDVVISYVKEACSNACASSGDLSSNETQGLSYTAETDETIYAIVEPYYGDSRADMPYHIKVNLHNSECGDGLTEGDEECDDHNTASNDGCSSDCKLEDGFICEGSAPTVCTPMAPGDSCKNPIEPDFGSTGYGTITYNAEGRNFDDVYTDQWTQTNDSTCYGSGSQEVIYKLHLLPKDVIVIQETSNDFDAVISLVKEVDNSCGTSCLRSTNEPEELVYIAEEEITLYAIVYPYMNYNNASHKPFSISIEKTHTECGNGIVEHGEDCDGGANHLEGCTGECKADDDYACVDNICTFIPDHCDSAIELESGDEIEFDTTLASNSISTLSCLSDTYESNLGRGNELFYQITVPAGQTLTAELTNLSSNPWTSLTLYLLSSCDDITESAQYAFCLTGANTNQVSTVTYTNSNDSAQVLYIVCDAYSNYYDGPRKLKVTLE